MSFFEKIKIQKDAIIGTSDQAKLKPWKCDLSKPIALVVGSAGTQKRRFTSILDVKKGLSAL
ncbi:MAG: hypothetical protein I8H72_05565 [Myxococcaceae bacterium]|nr:hypothetical protein [Myxococcaceae bacterium]